MNDYIESGARLSADERHRLLLWREWESSSKGEILFVLLNPSTATGTEDDPTVRRCVHFAKRLGGHKLSIVNLFSYRATDPKELPADRSLAFGGPANFQAILDASHRATEVVCAWGGHPTDGYDHSVVRLIAAESLAPLKCLGVGASGAPLHPCRLPNDQQIVPLPLPFLQRTVPRNVTFVFPKKGREVAGTWDADDFLFTAYKDALFTLGEDRSACYGASVKRIGDRLLSLEQRIKDLPNGAKIEVL